MVDVIMAIFIAGFVSYAIGAITIDIIWRSRLDDNNIEVKGWDKEGYYILEQG